MVGSNRIPLTRAALTLRVVYSRARDLVLSGALKGWQDSDGHWWVDQASLDAMKAEKLKQNA